VSEMMRETEPTPEERRDLLIELRGTVSRAQEGDEEALSKIEEIIKQTPSFARHFSDLNDRAERGYIEGVAGSDPLTQKSLPVRLEDMRSDLAGPNPSSLEQLCAERITSCWLQLQYADLLYVQNLPKLSLAEDEHYQKRLDRLQKRYLSAIRSLAQVRKLLKPRVTQINIGEKQINMAGEKNPHG
jgi:hypothetical protein